MRPGDACHATRWPRIAAFDIRRPAVFLLRSPPMPDRADYLARTLLARLRSLDAVLADQDGASESEKHRRRVELVEKVLAIDAGIVDGATHRLVLSAVPALDPGRSTSEKEQTEFAAFLRRELKV